MICPVCKQRWASFPEEDFSITEEGIQEIKEGAHERRTEVFNSDQEYYCGCIEADERYREFVLQGQDQSG